MTESFAILSQNYETHEKENALTNPADPATNEEIGTLPEMDVAATRECINAAAEAFKSWSTTTAKVTPLSEGFLLILTSLLQVRHDALKRMYDLMLENSDDLARIMVRTDHREPREIQISLFLF